VARDCTVPSAFPLTPLPPPPPLLSLFQIVGGNGNNDDKDYDIGGSVGGDVDNCGNSGCVGGCTPLFFYY
jgi:hypothetical protein